MELVKLVRLKKGTGVNAVATVDDATSSKAVVVVAVVNGVASSLLLFCVGGMIPDT